MLRIVRAVAAIWLLICAASLASASTMTVGFEELPDGTLLTTQYPTLLFTNAIVLTAGISLNESEFPAHSGTNVGSDLFGPMSIVFDTPVFTFSGYFTYVQRLTITAFDAEGGEVAMVQSAFNNNLACLAGPPCSGDANSTPNEFLQISSVAEIKRVAISGDAQGGSFTVDDLTISTGPAASVPEPRTDVLVASAAMLMLFLCRRYLCI